MHIDGAELAAFRTHFLVRLGRAFYWRSLLESGAVASGVEIAQLEGVTHGVVNSALRLTRLAPDIIEDLMHGAQPHKMTLKWCLRHHIPLHWAQQREMLRQFE